MATKEDWKNNGRDWLRTLNMFDDEELNTFERNLKADLESLLDEQQNAQQQIDNKHENHIDGECWIKAGNGFLAFQSAEANPGGTSYVRILNSCNVDNEIVYWDSEEWAEDPKGVMGAIMGALCSLLGPDKKL